MLIRHHRALPKCICQLGLIWGSYLDRYLCGFGSFCYVLHWTLCAPLTCSCHRWNHSKTRLRCSHQICRFAVCIHSWSQKGPRLWLCVKVPRWCLCASFSCGCLYNRLTCWQETYGSSVLGLRWLEGACILRATVSGSADSGRQFTFQGSLKSLLPREERLEWKDKLKTDRSIACVKNS